MSTKSKGLGDTVAKITKATGIDKLVHKVVGEDCGCEERQEALNKMVPYGPYLCAEDAETFRDEILPKARSGTLDRATSMQFINIFNRTFNTNEQPTTCSSCGQKLFQKLKKIYDEQYTSN